MTPGRDAAEVLAERIGMRTDGAAGPRIARAVRELAGQAGIDEATWARRLPSRPQSLSDLVDACVVRETRFFRDERQLEHLVSSVLPLAGSTGTIWCAGVADGHEAYSIAMLLEESGLAGWHVHATDVSARAVADAEAGVYESSRMRGLDGSRRDRFFTAAGDDRWEVRPTLRGRVDFARHNIATEGPPLSAGDCRVVFWRHVLIYLHDDAMRAALRRLHDRMPEDGRLFVGGDESIMALGELFALETFPGGFVYRPRPGAAPEAPPLPAGDGRTVSDAGTVLVADDSITVRTLLRTLLIQHGYTILEAEDGAEAVELAGAEMPDVVVTDLEMPRRNGLEVLGALKGADTTCHIPVIFLTADTSSVVAALERGAHDHLGKPFEVAELLARVGSAMRVKRLQDELRSVNQELERQACTDAVTGFYNRRFLDTHLAGAVASTTRHRRDLGVILVDVDHFKAINDTHGHSVGDAALVAVARRLRSRLRQEDLFGRWGGEEFMIVAPDTDAAGLAALADDLRVHVGARPLNVAGRHLDVTVSAGFASWRGDDAETLVRRADAAMYEAKNSGRNAVRRG